MSVIGEALLSAVINTLFDKLASTDLLQFARQEQIHSDLDKWKKILVKIEVVLDDAEEKQMTNRLVEIWLGELKNLAYDVEDILDEFATEALRRKLLNEPQATTSKVRKLIPTCCTGLNPRSLKLNSTMASQIKEITTRLQQIVEDKNSFDLKENSGGRSNRAIYRRPPATSLNEPHIYGREKDKEAIVELLLDDPGTNAKFSVISIEGMGGIGKTTLAQLVFNDDRVKHHFDIITWTCVSDDFNVTQVTKTILHSIAQEIGDPEIGDVNDPNMLQVRLKKKLFGKKFFIVLDDVWNESYENWTMLCRPLEGGSRGSKIIVTTRNHSVSLKVGALVTFSLKKLSNNHCLSLFAQHSLGSEDFSGHEHLEEIGKKIIGKCDGLPLAAKTVGGLLRGKVSCQDWEDVLDSNMWKLPQEESGIVPALKVSYDYLPSHLKRCFAYCSILPKGYEFTKEDVIWLWMAEGFLQIKSSKKEKEDLGNKCFEDLHSRSFFQQSSSNSSRFAMHDLINDLAQWAAEGFCFRVENALEGEKIPKNLRHLSYVNGGSNNECINKFEAFNELKSIRTFLQFTPVPWPHYSASDFLNMLPQLRRLRVLSLHGYPISELPNTIGELKHLRYLNLSDTKIEKLPNSINLLYNLETLILKDCSCLKNLCSDIGNLINMRHLNISYACPLEGMPSRIGRLTCLRTLPVYVVGKDDGFMLKELRNLTHLSDSLHISGLENVNDVEDAKEADFIGKKNLRELELKWTSGFSLLRNVEIETQVLDMLQPYKNLEKLTITGYGGTIFPSWLGNTSFSSLVLLRFEGCRNCTSLPPIGQLHLLKDLFIVRLAAIEGIGLEFYGNGGRTPFQSLENLCIKDMQEWKDWIHLGFGKDIVEFPCLRKLSIEDCPKLIGNLPEHLPSLESLCITRCEQMQMFIPSLPEDCNIEISRCKEVSWNTVPGSLLNSVVLSDISGCVFLAERFLQGSSKVARTGIVCYEKTISFKQFGDHSWEGINLSDFLFRVGLQTSVYGIEGLSFMTKEREELEQGLACRLQYLALRDCECLMKLPQLLHSLSFLRGLSLEHCPQLISIPEAALPSELRFIAIKNCDALESLPKSWMQSSNTSLERLSIEGCDSLMYIAKVQLPPNLKMLKIENCHSLQTLVEKEEVSITHEENENGGSCWNNFPLEYLYINGCSKLDSIAESFHGSTSLERIEIYNCINLKLLPNDLHNLSHLQDFCISGCGILFPEWLLPSVNLKTLRIAYCDQLDTLPSSMNNLTSLQSLSIMGCPGIISFPEDGFPTNLTSLSIIDVKFCKALFEWGLHKLTSLKQLSIWGGCPDVMPFLQEEIGMILPTSLTTLHIDHLTYLESLSSVFRNLISLEELHLVDCPKLKFFPKKGLPPSLVRLQIWRCPLLKQSCEKDGLYWPMISLIPCVHIDFKKVTPADEGALILYKAPVASG